MYATATITKDHLDSMTDGEPSEKGRVFETGAMTEADSPETTHRFKLVDDDGETYYSGTLRGDEDGVADLENRLFDWGAAFAGTAAIFIDGELVIG